MHRIRTFVFQHAIFFLTISSLMVLNAFPDNFKLFVLMSFLLFGLFSFVTKSIFFSLASLLFLTQHFLSPGKYYSFTLIEAGILRSEPYKSSGIVDGYGLLTSDIFALFILIYFVRLIILRDPHVMYQRVRVFFNDSFNRFLFSCWMIYVIVTLYSSLFLSFQPAFSVVNLLQFSKIVIFYIVFSLLFSKTMPALSARVGELLSGFSLGNAVLGIGHFLSDIQLSFLGGKPTEFYSSVEYESRLSSPKGYYLHSNEFALFSLVWALILTRIYQTSKSKIVLLAIALNVICVLISQSRTIWFIASCLLFIHVRSNLKKIQILLKNGRTKLYAILAVVILSTLTIPRIVSIRYSGQEGSLSIRSDMIKEGMEIFRMNPWTGFGAHTGVHVMLEYIPWGYIQDFPFEIHNAYLQMALESGIIGIVSFFLPFLVLVRSNMLGLVYQHAVKKAWFFNPFLIEALLVYYIVQPHAGRLEIPLLGVLLAFVKIYYHDHGKQIA